MSQKYKTQVDFRSAKGKMVLPQGTVIEITPHRHSPSRVDIRGNCPHCGSRIRGHMPDGPGLWNYIYETIPAPVVSPERRMLRVDEPLPDEGGTGFERSLQVIRWGEDDEEFWSMVVMRDSRGGESVLLNRAGMLKLRKYIDDQLGIDPTPFENGK